MKHWLLLSLLCVTAQTEAQNFYSWQYQDRYFSLTVGTGMTTYFGELNEKKELNRDLSNVSLGVEARLLSRLAARAELVYYNLKGDDRDAPDDSFARQRNLDFTSRNFEANLQAILYLRKYRGDYFKRWAVDPYMGIGIGATTYRPVTELDEITYNLRKVQTEGVAYKPVVLVLPLSFGLKLRFNEFVNMNAEVAYRYTFTDYLDDVSTTFLEEDKTIASRLSNRKRETKIGIEPAIINRTFFDQMVGGSPRGNPDTNDSYLMVSFRLEVYLPRKNGGPVLSKPSAY